MVEMTGDVALALPLIISCSSAYGVAHWLHDVPVYEALLKRDLWRGIFLTTPQRRSSRTKPTVS
jgi:CIC family chloride channel protein